MSHFVVLPSIDQSWTKACLDTCRMERIHVVDNTVENRGVAASWNVGARAVLDQDLDWLIILSAGVRFGAPGGLDFIEHLDAAPDAWAIEAGDGMGWHLIAFHRRCFEAVGLFDENYFAYYEDNDFSYRLQCHWGDEIPPARQLWPKVPVDATLAGVAHGLRTGRVVVDFAANLRYYESKHGGPPSKERYRTPFNLDVPLSWWPGDARRIVESCEVPA